MHSGRVGELGYTHFRISNRTTWTFVRVLSDSRRAGYGETFDNVPEALSAALRAWAPKLVNRPVDQALALCRHAGDVDPHERRALSAFEQALSDLRAQELGSSVGMMLGDVRRSQVELYANLNRSLAESRDAASFGRAAARACHAGFRHIKIAPFDDLTSAMCGTAQGEQYLEAGLERIGAVRDAIGIDASLMIDCHWRFDPPSSKDLVSRLREFGVTWLECPLPESLSSIEELRRIRDCAHAAGMRLAGADEVSDPLLFKQLIEGGAYDVVMPDVKYVGGLHGALQLCRFAESRGVQCSLHNPTGPIAHLHSVHVTSLIEGDLPLEVQFDETPLFAHIVECSEPLEQAPTIACPTHPGLGCTLRLPDATYVTLLDDRG